MQNNRNGSETRYLEYFIMRNAFKKISQQLAIITILSGGMVLQSGGTYSQELSKIAPPPPLSATGLENVPSQPPDDTVVVKRSGAEHPKEDPFNLKKLQLVLEGLLERQERVEIAAFPLLKLVEKVKQLQIRLKNAERRIKYLEAIRVEQPEITAVPLPAGKAKKISSASPTSPRPLSSFRQEGHAKSKITRVARPSGKKWLHRGSTLKLVRNGRKRRFVYVALSKDASLRGAKVGGLRFKGRKNSNTYSGTAYFHGRKCGHKTYKVKGIVSSTGKRLMLTGKAPNLNNKCRIVGYKKITLIFNLLQGKRQVSQPTLVSIRPSGKKWRHNGSIMTLVRNGSERRFLYKVSSKIAEKLGATSGRLRFKGTENGHVYSGTAYDYSGKCKRIGYQISGKISSRGRRVTMRGEAPQRNGRCRVVGRRSVVLIFSMM